MPLKTIWSAAGNLLSLSPARLRSGWPLSSVIGGAADILLPKLALNGGETLLPESWAPDESWLVWRIYPHIYNSAYLQKAGATDLTELAPNQPGNWIKVLGWIPARSAP